jgi:hypothetical protein
MTLDEGGHGEDGEDGEDGETEREALWEPQQSQQER